MSAFTARYLDPSGRARKARLEAQDRASAISKAEAELGPLISLSELPEAAHAQKAIPRRTLEEFTSLVSALLAASLSLKDALDIAVQTASRRDVRELAAALSERIGKGSSFSAALEAQGRLPPVYSGLVAVGERTASLPACMGRLEAFLRESKEIRDAAGGAMVYPLIVLSTAAIGMSAVSIFALPKLRTVFSELGAAAAAGFSARLNSASLAMGILTALLLGGVAAGLILSIARRSSKSAALAIDRAVLGLPLIGRAVAESCMLDFAFAMESLCAGGFPLDAAIPEAARTARNAYFESRALAVREELRKGASLSQAMSRSRVFPAFAAQWVAVGERTGEVASVFGQLRGFYAGLAKRRAQAFTRLIEPAMSVAIGLVVVFLITNFVIPLFEAMGSLIPLG